LDYFSGELSGVLTQRIVDPPQEQSQSLPASQPLSRKHLTIFKAGIVSALVVIGMLMLLFSGQLALSLIQDTHPATQTTSPSPTSAPGPQSSVTITSSIIVPGHENAPPLQLQDGQYIVYEQNDALYLVSDTGDYTQVIPTPGFISSGATPPILTPGGQIIYSGNGIWMTSLAGGNPAQIAPLEQGQVITSMALSSDGKMLAWSTEPANGSGTVVIHAGPLTDPTIVLEQSAQQCPCFRIFSFLNGTSARADTTLLLTDDGGGSNEAAQYGLWSLDLTQTSPTPHLILDENSQQGPLALSSPDNTLLYSTSEGAVPTPADLALPIPGDFVTLSYANSLSIGEPGGSPLALNTKKIILPEQNDLNNSALYHWVTTPQFSPDAHTLAYAEFSSDAQNPYDRHYALYTVSITGSGAHLAAGRPKLLATSSNQIVELGPWLNNYVLTLYADGTLYALDINTGSMSILARPNSYARIVAVVGPIG
jgi:hypothetical protein